MNYPGFILGFQGFAIDKYTKPFTGKPGPVATVNGLPYRFIPFGIGGVDSDYHVRAFGGDFLKSFRDLSC